jgi:hypothetical protein
MLLRCPKLLLVLLAWSLRNGCCTFCNAGMLLHLEDCCTVGAPAAASAQFVRLCCLRAVAGLGQVLYRAE